MGKGGPPDGDPAEEKGSVRVAAAEKAAQHARHRPVAARVSVGRAWRTWLSPLACPAPPLAPAGSSEPPVASVTLFMKTASSPRPATARCARRSPASAPATRSTLAKSPRTCGLTRSFEPGCPMPRRTRRYSLPRCASIERSPLCPPCPPPVFTRTLPAAGRVRRGRPRCRRAVSCRRPRRPAPSGRCRS